MPRQHTRTGQRDTRLGRTKSFSSNGALASMSSFSTSTLPASAAYATAGLSEL